MCRNVTSIQMTQLKNDCVFTLNIKTCHLTEGTNDNEIQCFRLGPFWGVQEPRATIGIGQGVETRRQVFQKSVQQHLPNGHRVLSKSHRPQPRDVRSSALHARPCFPGKWGGRNHPPETIQRSMQRRRVILNNSKK